MATAIALALCLSSGCVLIDPEASTKPQAPPGAYAELKAAGERWLIAGIALSERREGRPVDDWSAVWEFPTKKVTGILSQNAPMPDGKVPIRLMHVAYNQGSGSLMCMEHILYTPPKGVTHYADVWFRDLRQDKAAWVARHRWRSIGGMAWSPDGRRAAFMATPEQITGERRRAEVCIYDTQALALTLAADDGGLIEDASERNHAPAWSPDGRFLYYASFDYWATRLDLQTGETQRLPFSASSVLAARGEWLVYTHEKVGAPPGEGRFTIRKCRLDAEDETEAIDLYKANWLWLALVSPSGRFVYFKDKTHYLGGHEGLLDTDTGKVDTGVEGGAPEMFTPMSTAWTRK
jgi:hypothetical protein